MFHQLSNKIEIALGELSELNERYDALKQEISLKEVELRKLEQAITAGLAKHEQFLARLGRNQEDLLEVSTQKEDITLSLEEIRALWQESMDQLESFSGERESLQNQKEQLISSLDEVRRQSKEAQNRAHQLQLSRQQKVSQQRLKHSLGQIQLMKK